MARPKGKKDSCPRGRAQVMRLGIVPLKVIAKQLGLNVKTVDSALRSGIYKLRKNPELLREVIGLAQMRQELRISRIIPPAVVRDQHNQIYDLIGVE